MCNLSSVLIVACFTSHSDYSIVPGNVKLSFSLILTSAMVGNVCFNCNDFPNGILKRKGVSNLIQRSRKAVSPCSTRRAAQHKLSFSVLLGGSVLVQNLQWEVVLRTICPLCKTNRCML